VDSSHWQMQLECRSIQTSHWRKLKKKAYQRRKQQILLDRKERELANVCERCPQGRLHHLAKQIGRIENHVQAR
jgi:hypothetical protein